MCVCTCAFILFSSYSILILMNHLFYILCVYNCNFLVQPLLYNDNKCPWILELPLGFCIAGQTQNKPRFNQPYQFLYFILNTANSTTLCVQPSETPWMLSKTGHAFCTSAWFLPHLLAQSFRTAINTSAFRRESTVYWNFKATIKCKYLQTNRHLLQWYCSASYPL